MGLQKNMTDCDHVYSLSCLIRHCYFVGLQKNMSDQWACVLVVMSDQTVLFCGAAKEHD